MTRPFEFATAAALLVMLGACSTFEPSQEWRKAEAVTALDVPPELDTPHTGAEMQIPEVEENPLISDLSPPMLDRSLRVAVDAATAWRQLGATLDGTDLVKVLGRDETALSYRVSISGADLIAELDPGMLDKFLHRGPDPDRDYHADIEVVGNGENSTLRLNGDALAVMRLRRMFQETGLRTVPVEDN